MNIKNGDGEYVPFVEDLMRMTTIQLTMQLLMTFQGVAAIDMSFLVYLMQVLVGVSAYWLIVRRAVGI
jgi:hypothetical protein